MNRKSHKSNVKESVGMLQAAFRLGSLKGHPSQAAVATKGHEVLASWGPMMRK